MRKKALIAALIMASLTACGKDEVKNITESSTNNTITKSSIENATESTSEPKPTESIESSSESNESEVVNSLSDLSIYKNSISEEELYTSKGHLSTKPYYISKTNDKSDLYIIYDNKLYSTTAGSDKINEDIIQIDGLGSINSLDGFYNEKMVFSYTLKDSPTVNRVGLITPGGNTETNVFTDINYVIIENNMLYGVKETTDNFTFINTEGETITTIDLLALRNPDDKYSDYFYITNDGIHTYIIQKATKTNSYNIYKVNITESDISLSNAIEIDQDEFLDKTKINLFNCDVRNINIHNNYMYIEAGTKTSDRHYTIIDLTSGTIIFTATVNDINKDIISKNILGFGINKDLYTYNATGNIYNINTGEKVLDVSENFVVPVSLNDKYFVGEENGSKLSDPVSIYISSYDGNEKYYITNN